MESPTCQKVGVSCFAVEGGKEENDSIIPSHCVCLIAYQKFANHSSDIFRYFQWWFPFLLSCVTTFSLSLAHTNTQRHTHTHTHNDIHIRQSRQKSKSYLSRFECFLVHIGIIYLYIYWTKCMPNLSIWLWFYFFI